MAIVTLTTDFGQADYYVGAMKGVIYQLAPKATVVDISHDVPAGDILAGALILREIWRTFPPATIHVAVIDPGVGTDRRIVLARYADQLILAPDNGLLTLIDQSTPPDQINVVTNASMFCDPVSPTFHGRDIFAPVAGRLAKNAKSDQVGPQTDQLILLDLPTPYVSVDQCLTGQVIHVDRFGNLVCNITNEQLRTFASRDRTLAIDVAGQSIGPLGSTFGDGKPGQAVAYIGSADLLEIAVNQGRADETFSANVGATVSVC